METKNTFRLRLERPFNYSGYSIVIILIFLSGVILYSCSRLNEVAITSSPTSVTIITEIPSPTVKPTITPDLPAPSPTPRVTSVSYTVLDGDTVESIARKFNLEPRTILWENKDLLFDNPDYLLTDMVLKIPPVDGVSYQVQADDNLEIIAVIFGTTEEKILNWPGNGIDPNNPVIFFGSWLFLPEGKKILNPFSLPEIPRTEKPDQRAEYGLGACPGAQNGNTGDGTFQYPTDTEAIQGNTYFEGHPGVDLATTFQGDILAADDGVVVFAGWAYGGFGYSILLDHGNGYQSLYSHLGEVNVSCGDSVFQGNSIGTGGDSFSASGPDLHFEIRYNGTPIDPLPLISCDLWLSIQPNNETQTCQ
ncbi:MAG: peptidoglycan DD-metalloendopeptidase family protein [Anaerolineales bacterium]|nr:peptidoglycan DD-metalloendopeptidase family protein [Anaerolineales bacterium]